MTELSLSRPWNIAIANQKGGVGKTTTALSLAAAIDDSSGAVLVMDADPQQSALEIAAAGPPLPFEVRSARSAAELAGIRNIRGVDTVLIDLPGNLDDTPVLGEVLAASDFCIIPLIPEKAAIEPTRADSAHRRRCGSAVQDPFQSR